DEKRGRKVIESIIDMAKKLDMKTVAEGVENVEQVEFLKSVNCNYVQGYYFSKPIPIKDFETNYIYTPENNLPKNFL
ncbi:MAG: EAL domain-containing protein, partial [Oscillospiraceae bacterium]